MKPAMIRDVCRRRQRQKFTQGCGRGRPLEPQPDVAATSAYIFSGDMKDEKMHRLSARRPPLDTRLTCRTSFIIIPGCVYGDIGLIGPIRRTRSNRAARALASQGFNKVN